MSAPLAAYSFLPWARHGLGTFVRENDQDAGVKLRGSIDVSLQFGGEHPDGSPISETLPPRAVELYGPGDVIGIDRRSIVRTEPRDWITNFEPNYMPFVEFYDEDFPWRYTPAKASADNKKLRPWLTLVVLDEAEIGVQGNGDGKSRPLPFIEVADASQKFPPADQLWAWGHVHVSRGSTVDPSDVTATAAELAATLAEDRDLGCSRLLCPRILEPNKAYHAFLVPTFEAGRLAGLGKNPGLAPFATASAWADYPGRLEGTSFPYYFRWFFRTGSAGDFEYLVRLLVPQTVDARVGHRDMDVQAPGANLPAITKLGGILRLGGALRAPLITLSDTELKTYQDFENWASPGSNPFQISLASLVNLDADYKEAPALDANAASGIVEIAEDDDPLVVPPLYGRWHSETSRLDPVEADPLKEMWVQELNLDPRHRTAAGFGTRVVQKYQEDYMEAAWSQVGRVIEANQKIRFGQAAEWTSKIWHEREFTVLGVAAPEQAFVLIAPLHPRLVADGFTIRHQLKASTLTPAAVSKVMRQAIRPSGPLVRRIGKIPWRDSGNILARMNLPDGDPDKVTAAPPKVVAPGLPTGAALAEKLSPLGLPQEVAGWLVRHRLLLLILLALAFLCALLLFAVAPLLAIVLAVAAAAGVVLLSRLLAKASAVISLDPETRTPASVDELRLSPDFALAEPGATSTPSFGKSDSAEAAKFKAALRNLYSVDEAERTIVRPVRRPIDLKRNVDVAVRDLQPARTVRKRLLGTISIPTRILDRLTEPFGEVMAYPEIDVPMYEPLKALSNEAFLPNIQLIPPNSITLLETNQKFIESYLVGANHEFARELLWREYPTDQRGSYFRQFWDVRGYLSSEPDVDPLVLRERLRDIPELHLWWRDSALGAHDHREEQGDKEEEVVLAIRGELLKKYPTAVIYAHRAQWERKSDGSIDKGKPRKLADLTEAEAKNPPRTLVKTPLYEAKIDPDIYFFGFDLTAETARGGQTVAGEEDPGWFFVIKERPGEPRFGLDMPKDAPQSVFHSWNDLAWTDVVSTYTPGAHLAIGEKTVTLSDPGLSSPAKQQYDEDFRFAWRADTHSAELAYILYQVPVLMAVHAAEMLKKL